MVVLGEPGIGKTALVTAFTDELRSAGTTVSVARAERDDRRTSLLPWRRVLASLLGLPSDSDGFAVLERLIARVHGQFGDRWATALAWWRVGHRDPSESRDATPRGAHRADATMRLLGDLIGALAPRPLVLVLEDSQWLDFGVVAPRRVDSWIPILAAD